MLFRSPIEIEDKEIDELKQIELEIPELWLYSTRQDATTFIEDTFWVPIGFTLAKSMHELAMSEILAAARARAKKIDHLDWTTGPDPCIYMFVVSGHLYRPLPSSQPCGLRVKIKDGFGTRPPRRFLVPG